ncbi:collagenase [Bacillus cereus]|uniref:collagenase ColA n=2 Tax=Bacillus cereus TaxID=1396 RepID=UPI000BECA5B1|nr:collagenase ColA [Bacillus cereus]PEG01016.1 collagenase [Bacillus cereus]PER02060.1 collagenase [Bacillus cereus]PEW53394.1 collagenase [Bacillus cereus]PEX43148.1 collagenase [Bacillus cereus]PEZ83122.1 collagenase [Bacillus cereus]
MNKNLKFTQLIIGMSTMALSFGSIQTQVSAEEKAPYNLLQMKPIGTETSKDEMAHATKADETLNFEERLKVGDFSQRPTSVMKLDERQLKQSYTLAELNKMSDSEFIDTLSRVSWNQITDLFQFNQDTKAFYQNKERMNVIIDELGQRGKSFTKEDSKGIETFVEVLRSAFYVGYFNNEVGYLKERSFHDKCLPSLKAIAKNPNFTLGTAEQDRVVVAYGKLISNASSDAETVQYAANILKQFNDNLSMYAKNYTKEQAVYEIVKGIDYDLQSYLQETNKKPNATMWYGKIDNFINEVSRIALIRNLTTENSWLINNGIYYAGRLGKFHSNSNKGLEVITQAMNIYPRLSGPYFIAVEQIKTNYGGKDYDGNAVDLQKIREEGKLQYLPKTYTFDDGSIVFKTGDKVTEEKIKRLYWAAKEVKAQYHRVIGNDKALEQGNADDVLTVVIYNNPDDYQLNRQLYGYETNNGGIYIEEKGTFFTYERTPKQSIYSLEELFRHEFTHYLQGRYEVPGLFGSGELYQNERLTWFQEGNAEFFAGSTRTNNVVPRKSIISGLSSDPASRYTAKQTLFAKYGSWDFYNYSFALQSYLYNHHFETFDKIQDLIRANDVKNYDAYRESLSKDAQLNTEYQTYMQQLIDNQDKYNVPQVTNDYLIQHAPKPLAEVKKEIVDVTNIKDAKITKHESQFFNTFTMEGKYIGSTSKGESEDWKTMSKQVNQTLEQLSQKGWSGYKTVTAYFVNYRVNAANQFEYDIVFHGVATEEKEKTTTIVNMNGPYSGIVNEGIQFHSDGTESENGKVISYLWNFGDGTTSTEANPTHVYGEKGTYTVELIVKDSRGKESKEQTKVTVKQDPQIGGSHEEEKVLQFNKLVKGNLIAPDQTDVYTFNVTVPKEVDISVVNEQNIGMTWVLYHESDMQNYVACGEDEGNAIKGKFVAKPGKYYLNVYKFDDNNGEYSLIVK